MSAEPNAQVDYWRETFWMNDDLPWHFKTPNKFLVKHEARLVDGKTGIRILVPLCGKSVDLKWLYDQGHEVIGVEGTPFAIEAFFRENKLQYTMSNFESHGFKYQTPDQRLTILNCNLLTLKDHGYKHTCDAVWDRASLVAVRPEHRPLFAKNVKGFLKPNFRYLIEAIEYDSTKVYVEPFALFEKELEQLYSDCAKITQLESCSVKETEKEPLLSHVVVFEVVYILQNK